MAGLHKELTFVRNYTTELASSQNKIVRKAHLRGAVFGLAQSIPFFTMAACMYYGGVLVDDGKAEYDEVTK